MRRQGEGLDAEGRREDKKLEEARSNVLAEHPQFGRSLLPSPAVSRCSGAEVSIAQLCWTPVPQQLSPTFFCIIRLLEKAVKTPSKQGL